jgi:hypothetical protein
VVAILAPEADHVALRRDIGALAAAEQWNRRPILDPHWGLERMIVALAGIAPSEIGPFPDGG